MTPRTDKQQFVALVLSRGGPGPLPLPDGFEDLAGHNRQTFKSHQEALSGLAEVESACRKGGGTMIELTEELRKALREQTDEPLRLIDPITQEAFVLLRAADYARLKEEEYDTSPWTDEEMDLLAAEDADSLGWEGMEVYQYHEP